MLVISRKTEEYLQIGDDIIVKVIRSSNGSVKIGVEAPAHMRVLRGELQENREFLPKTLGKVRRPGMTDACEGDRLQPAEAV